MRFYPQAFAVERQRLVVLLIINTSLDIALNSQSFSHCLVVVMANRQKTGFDAALHAQALAFSRYCLIVIIGTSQKTCLDVALNTQALSLARYRLVVLA